MHFLYVDESGDPGAKHGASRHFILCGLLVHHADWHAVNRRMAEMRARLFATHGLPMMAELHASEFLSDSSNHMGLSQRARLQYLLHVLGCIQRQGDLTPICVIIEKGGTNPLAPARYQDPLHRPRLALAERLHRIVQRLRPPRAVLHALRGPGRVRRLDRRLQRLPAAWRHRLPLARRDHGSRTRPMACWVDTRNLQKTLPEATQL
ncbi:insertion element IS407 uncharacterized 31.7 kDa protein [Verrucomicrobiota bacterium]|nr:insertion element IS407 uncharacterized 31.7 kDa protein [Verrucomicrobiota bacterium]